MNDSSSKSNRTQICPHCKQTLAEVKEFFPFCSKRCQLIDLGAWAAEKYSIPGAAASSAEADKDQEE